MLISLAFGMIGCDSNKRAAEDKKTATATSGQPGLFEQLDLRRLRFPAGWRDFENDLQNATIQVGIEKKALSDEKIDSLCKRARQFMASDNCPHPHDIVKFSEALIVCAQSCCLSDQSDKAIALLKEASEMGMTDSQLLKSKAFDKLRESDEFKSLKIKEFNNVLAPFLVKKPLFKIQELLAADTQPAMPGYADVEGKVLVVFTGLQLSPEDVKTLQAATEAGALAFAMVTEKLATPTDGISVHVSGLNPDALMPDLTPMIWVTSTQGEVVAYLRTPADGILLKSLAEYLQQAPISQKSADK